MTVFFLNFLIQDPYTCWSILDGSPLIPTLYSVILNEFRSSKHSKLICRELLCKYPVRGFSKIFLYNAFILAGLFSLGHFIYLPCTQLCSMNFFIRKISLFEAISC